MAQHAHVMLVGGGTGGHFYPLMSVADALRTTVPNLTLSYIGPDAYDEASLAERGIRYEWCPAGKRRRYSSILNFFDLFKMAFGVCMALIKLYILYPDVVVSKGGYTSVPVVLAAAFFRIPIIVHESDSVPGSANRLGARFARSVLVAYDHMEKAFPKHTPEYVGIPIRAPLLAPKNPNARALLGIQNELPTLLVIGGSQGAERINTLILDSLDELLPHFNIIHQTGKQHFDLTVLTARKLIVDPELLGRYHPTPFLDAATLNSAYHEATVVISRAGSTSIHEIALHEKPSIIIPIPEDVSHDQRSNAYAYARSGAAIVLEESNLTDSLLQAELDRMMQNTELYDGMVASARTFARKNAATHIAQIVNQLVLEH